MLMGMLYPFLRSVLFACFEGDVSYMREASAVAPPTTMGKPEPQDAGRATDTDSSRFLFYLVGLF